MSSVVWICLELREEIRKQQRQQQQQPQKCRLFLGSQKIAIIIFIRCLFGIGQRALSVLHNLLFIFAFYGARKANNQGTIREIKLSVAKWFVKIILIIVRGIVETWLVAFIGTFLNFTSN